MTINGTERIRKLPNKFHNSRRIREIKRRNTEVASMRKSVKKSTSKIRPHPTLWLCLKQIKSFKEIRKLMMRLPLKVESLMRINKRVSLKKPLN